MRAYLDITKLPLQIGLGIFLFLLPFFVTHLFFQYNPEIATRNLLNILPIKAHFLVCYAFIGVLLATSLKKEDKLAYWLVVVGISYLCWHLFTIERLITTDMIPSYDLPDHIKTIGYIAHNKTLPPIAANIQSHQPPLYYIVSAVIYALTNWLGFRSFVPLNFVSLLYFFIFLIYGTKLIVLLLQNPLLRYSAVIGLIWWPANMVHCCRISNDVPIYSIMMMFMYYSIVWYKTHAKRAFVYAILLTALGFLIKLSAAIMLITGTVILAFKAFDLKNMRAFLNTLPSYKLLIVLSLILALCAPMSMARVAYYNHTTNQDASYLLGTAYDERFIPRNYVPVIANYFTFNYTHYLLQPLGKDFVGFWGLRLRTTLYPRLQFIHFQYPVIAILLGFTFLLALINSGFLLLYQTIFRHATLPIVNILFIFQIIALLLAIAMNTLTPHPGWAIARHVYPIAPLFLFLYALLIQYTKSNNQRLHYLSAGIFTFLIAFTLLFSILQLFLPSISQ